jgi:hypothetical protein
MDEVAKHMPPLYVDPFADLEEEHQNELPLHWQWYWKLSVLCGRLANSVAFQAFITLW